MRLNDASVAIRPRTAWESLDLGILLARRHAGLLMLAWASLTLPIFGLLTLLFWEYPTLALLLFWWMKPLYERLPLFILSHALFGPAPTLRESLRALPGLLKPQWLASLLWRRLSLTRSYDLPVVQLERLSGAERKKRLVVLGQRDSGTATWLTIVGMHLEGALSLGAVALLYLLIPEQMLSNWQWQDLLFADGPLLWLEHLSNLLYALVLILWEPIYVSCGFCLYLNRRTHLEAWDLELSFKRLRERLQGMLPMLFAASLMLVAMQPNAWAEATEAGPDQPRLLHQPLTSQAAQEAINELFDQPPFRNSETVTRWRFGDEQSEDSPSWLSRLLEGLSSHKGLSGLLKQLTQVLEILLWGLFFTALGWLIWRYRDWIRLHVSRARPPVKRARQAPQLLFGMAVQPESLPNDIAGEVDRLWESQPRAALGLLYRALLSRLLHQHELPLTHAHTEEEVLQLVRGTGQAPLIEFTDSLTHHWLSLAYGHRQPPASARDELCTQWKTLFGSGVAP